MRRRYLVVIPVLIGVGLLAALLFSNRMPGRNNQWPGQYGITQQGRNFTGDNILRRNTGTGPNAGNMPGNNTSYGNNTGLTKIGQQIGFNPQKADNISKQLGNIDGVRNISTIVNGNTALISYSPTKITRDANTTKNMITRKVKQIDKTITNVVVSNSADISARIGRLENNIRNNKTTNNLNNEFNQLIQSIKRAG